MSLEELPSTQSPVTKLSFTDRSTATATQPEVMWQLLTHAPRLLVFMDDKTEALEKKDGVNSFLSEKHISVTLSRVSEKRENCTIYLYVIVIRAYKKL